MLDKIDDLLEKQRNQNTATDIPKDICRKECVGEYMSSIKRLEGKRDFLMKIVAYLKKVPWNRATISELFNISWEEVDYIDQEFNSWKEEQIEKKLGAAEVIEQIKINNPKYRLDSQKYNLSMILGISIEELTELERILENQATIKK